MFPTSPRVKIVGVGVALLVLGAGLFVYGRNAVAPVYTPVGGDISAIKLGGREFMLEVMRTDAERAKGLSGHAPLGVDEGMLFVFDAPGKQGFWMPDMQFAIDIIWIAADVSSGLSITHIEHNVAPDTYPQVFAPPATAADSLYVLELAAGTAESLKLKIGDTVEFRKK